MKNKTNIKFDLSHNEGKYVRNDCLLTDSSLHIVLSHANWGCSKKIMYACNSWVQDKNMCNQTQNKF